MVVQFKCFLISRPRLVGGAVTGDRRPAGDGVDDAMRRIGGISASVVSVRLICGRWWWWWWSQIIYTIAHTTNTRGRAHI